jgi:hypothetical protein
MYTIFGWIFGSGWWAGTDWGGRGLMRERFDWKTDLLGEEFHESLLRAWSCKPGLNTGCRPLRHGRSRAEILVFYRPWCNWCLCRFSRPFKHYLTQKKSDITALLWIIYCTSFVPFFQMKIYMFWSWSALITQFCHFLSCARFLAR